MFENSFLTPLLERYYPDEDSFNKEFEDLIKRAGDLYLDKKLGLSVNITNIGSDKETKGLIRALKNNSKFTPISKDIFDQIDEGLFEEDTEFLFKRYVFRSIDKIDTGIKDKDGCDVSFRLFVNIARTNLSYHIVSFTFTTWNTKQEYIKLSNSQIIDAVNREFSRIRKNVLLLFEQNQNIEKIIKMDKNTFISFQFWVDDWKNDNNNLLDAREYVKNHPHYFYSLISLYKRVFRRHYENMMGTIGRGFSTSRTYVDIFSQNVFLEITIKPIKDRFKTIGYDASTFRIWEILALQRTLLLKINKITTLKNAEKLIRELYKVYDFNTLIRKKGKGIQWIKFTRYLQYITRIDFDYEVYKRKIEKGKEEKLEKDSLRLQKLNFLILATIFVSIFTFLLSEYPIELTDNSFAYFIKISLFATIFVALFFLFFLPFAIEKVRKIWRRSVKSGQSIIKRI